MIDTYLPNTQTESVYQQQLDNIVQAIDQHSLVLKDFGLEEGTLGLSLFYCYYALFTEQPRYLDIAQQYFDHSVSNVDPKKFKRVNRTDTFDARLAGLGKFIQFAVRNKLLEIEENNFLASVDEVMGQLMMKKIQLGDFGFWTGALSSAHYFYYRMESGNSYDELFQKLTEGLLHHHLEDQHGNYYWKTPTLRNQVYLGLSHGSAAIISFLAALVEKGVGDAHCKQIIEKSVRFVLEQERTCKFGRFPIMIGDQVEPKQFSICYGDLGVVYGLFRASQLLLSKNDQQQIHSLLNDCQQRTLAQSLIGDASIIYGVSGVSHLFEKMYELGGDRQNLERAQYWLRQIPKYHHGDKYAGYKTMVPQVDPSYQLSFGWGLIGIGISIMRLLKPDLPGLNGLTLTI